MSNADKIRQGNSEQALARLYSGEITEGEVEVIREMAADDCEYRDDLLGSQEFLANLEALADDTDICAIADEPSVRDVRRKSRWPAYSMAAGMILAVGVGVVGYFQSADEIVDGTVQRYVTRVGEQKNVELDDGSVVTLNTATQVLVGYSDTERRIVLDRGEAYFDVIKDPERPFTVELGLRSVTVLGTEFNLYKLPDKYELAVLEGVVALHEPSDEVSVSAPLVSVAGSGVRAGQRRVEAGWVVKFDVASTALTTARPEAMEQYREWRTGLVQFHREPLYKVVQELNRYSGKKILIEDKSIMDLSVFATVDVNELNSALNALEMLLPIKIVRHYDRIVITGSE